MATRTQGREKTPPPRAAAAIEDRISWDDLRYVEALDRLGQARRAGRELGTSVSTVYRRIAALEAIVGARCVETGGAGGLRLTAIGRSLAVIARGVDTSIAEVTQQARFAESDVSGEVSLTTTEGFVPLVSATLATLCERHPRLTVALHVADQGPSVRRREVDVALSLIPSPPPSLRGRRLFAIRYGVFGTAAAARSDPLRWVIRGASFANTVQAAWEKEHASDVAIRTTSLSTTMALLRAGVGVAVLPERLARLEPDFVEVERYRTLLNGLERTAWILTHPDIHAVPRVRVLVDALVAALARET